jgi:hypothetical protein
MSDEVIAHLNSLSANRKISKTSNVRQPVFELYNRILYDDDDADYDDEWEDLADPVMIHPHGLPEDDEHVANELKIEFDVPDEVRDETPGRYEHDDILRNR